MSLLGQSLFDRPTQLLFSDRSVEACDFSMLGIKHDRHRLIRHVVQGPHLGSVGEGIRHAESLCVIPAVLDRVIVRNSDERDFLCVVLSQLVEVGLFPLALWSPRLPEVEDYRRPSMVRERERVTVERLHLEIGCSGAGLRGRSVAPASAQDRKEHGSERDPDLHGPILVHLQAYGFH
jgi:hypothetical protein